MREHFCCKVINPATLPDGLNYRQYMAHAIQLLTMATVVVVLPNHRNSLGTQIELSIAMRDGIRILTYDSIFQKEGMK